ncbi:MAG: glycosyltransferase family 2 protein [Myxococcota bacterium]|jgi:glycosyltransferase involved in cell wall biosynthesis|nr:glycosyltransferase family 2 protein [Myxococcota bacterium]
MKLIIQIPCFNEAKTLSIALGELPKQLPGIDELELLVIDDGSQDDTVHVAREWGVHHVVGFRQNQGLARAFMLGINACLERGADIIVNTDADNQYNAGDIPALIQPILEHRADLVIGARPITEIAHFSPIKKLLQLFGSYVVRRVSGTNVLDAPSGFRAISRDAALTLNVFNDYTYTLETLIQAGQKGMRVVSTPVRVNGDLRPSRLVKSIPSYVKRSILTIFRIFIVYQPLKFFLMLGSVPFLAGLALGVRFLISFFQDGGDGHIQSLILAAVLLLMGFLTYLLAIIADLLSVNRRLLEDIQRHQRTRLVEVAGRGEVPKFSPPSMGRQVHSVPPP